MLISPEYQALLRQKHTNASDWGSSSAALAPLVRRVIQDFAPLTVLDYGCGKQALARALPQYYIRGYDPGIPGIDAPPEPAEMVVSTDVLEHIEPACLDDVLDDIERVTSKICFLVVSTRRALHDLPDGRNAHLIVEPPRWWLPKLLEHFDPVSFAYQNHTLQFIGAAINPTGNGHGRTTQA